MNEWLSLLGIASALALGARSRPSFGRQHTIPDRK